MRGYGGRTRFLWFALICAAGVAMHLVYDLVTPWGTMLLYPFSAERFALDWLFIVDLVTWALPAGVLVVSRRRPSRGRAAVAVWAVWTSVGRGSDVRTSGLGVSGRRRRRNGSGRRRRTEGGGSAKRRPITA